MIDTVFEFLFVASTILALGVLLRRLKHVEGQLDHMRRNAAARAVPTPPQPPPAAGVEVLDLCVSPLSIILAQCELARGAGAVDERMELIERQARRMGTLIHRERKETDRVRWEAHMLDPGACVRAAVEHHSALADERGVRVHVMVDPAPQVEASPFLLPHALRHLVRAAIESAAANEGDVTVAVGEFPPEGNEPTHVGFAVYDDGPGLDPVALGRIFEPTPGEDYEPSQEELSYSIVSAVAQAIEAQFVIESAPAAGTSATLKIPLVPSKRHEDETQESPQQVFVPVAAVN